MKWTALFAMQQKLDTYIVKTHQLEQKDLFEEKVLALLVELGELANETRCFKYWSNKAGSDRSVILEEYVDNIHFILSLGLDSGFRYRSRELSKPEHSLTNQFHSVYAASLAFKGDQTESTYETLFTEYLKLGILLGFTEDDIHEAYHKKNEINFKRQDEGY